MFDLWRAPLCRCGCRPESGLWVLISRRNNLAALEDRGLSLFGCLLLRAFIADRINLLRKLSQQLPARIRARLDLPIEAESVIEEIVDDMVEGPF